MSNIFSLLATSVTLAEQFDRDYLDGATLAADAETRQATSLAWLMTILRDKEGDSARRFMEGSTIVNAFLANAHFKLTHDEIRIVLFCICLRFSCVSLSDCSTLSDSLSPAIDRHFGSSNLDLDLYLLCIVRRVCSLEVPAHIDSRIHVFEVAAIEYLFDNASPSEVPRLRQLLHMDHD